MKISLVDKIKKDLFIALFNIIKTNTSSICCIINSEKLYIQGMDKSHICLFDININKKWFNEFELSEDKQEIITFDTQKFYTIINTVSESQTINIYTKTDDFLFIDLVANEYKKKEEFNKHFKLSLNENDYEIMNIPETDYNCDILINSKKICDIISQMSNFGDDLRIQIKNDDIIFSTNSNTGEMNVKLSTEEFDEILIDEEIEHLDFTYSIYFINRMCLTNKLSSKIFFHLSKELPMKIKYDLGEEFIVCFYIAPKLDD
jgi:proliferating cell nuclear antigen